jgi:hypothetical protein
MGQTTPKLHDARERSNLRCARTSNKRFCQ